MSALSSDPAATTEDCRFCWMCRHVCPVGHVTRRETLTPHAWALLIDSVQRGTMAWNAETADVLYQCADCGLCRAHCVTDRPLPDAIALARAAVAAAGLAPKAAYEAREAFEHGLTAVPADRAGETAGDVALFVGETGTADAASLEAALTLLRAAGVVPVPIAAGRANGVAANALGFPDTARAQARAVLDAIGRAGSTQLLVLGPGDRYAFERLYGERLDVAWPEGVAVREVTEVLAEALAAGTLRFDRRAEAAYAYHDPCHSPRVAGHDFTAPRTLLAAALGADDARRMFWREERAHPCGSVGALTHTHPDLAAQLTDARLADAAAAGATLLVTDDPACLRHLQSRSASGVSVVGLYELLAARLIS